MKKIMLILSLFFICFSLAAKPATKGFISIIGDDSTNISDQFDKWVKNSPKYEIISTALTSYEIMGNVIVLYVVCYDDGK